MLQGSKVTPVKVEEMVANVQRIIGLACAYVVPILDKLLAWGPCLTFNLSEQLAQCTPLGKPERTLQGTNI
jgi:hypothetical protein